MSVQSEITRLQNAKAAIKTAIEGKGVTVPDATLLDGMAALIAEIEAGGCTITSGSFTPASDPTYGYEITHGLGKIPVAFVCWIAEDITGSATSSYFLCGVYPANEYTQRVLNIYNSTVTTNASNKGIENSSGDVFRRATENTIRVANTCVLSTKTYSWIAVG